MPLFLGAILTSCPFTAEDRQKLRADELRREYHEEQRNEFENFVEEQNDGKSSSASISGEWGFVGKSRGASTSSANILIRLERESLLSCL